MNCELFQNAFSEGLAAIISEISSYPISRFNESLHGKKREKWSPYKFVNLKTEIKSLFLKSFPYGFTFNTAFAFTYPVFLNQMKLPNKIALGIGAALSECIAEIIKIPISNLSQTIQDDQSTSLCCALKKRKNMKDLFEGYLPTIMTTIPFYFTIAPVLEHIKGKVLKNKKQFTMKDCLWVSAVSIAISNMVATPVDVMTSNLLEKNKKLTCKNYVNEFRIIMKSGNPISQFYKNLSQRNVGGLAGVVYITSCEKITSLVQNQLGKQ